MNFPDPPPPSPVHTTNSTKLFAIFFSPTVFVNKKNTWDWSNGETVDDCPPPIWDSTLWSVINPLDTKPAKSSDVITTADDCCVTPRSVIGNIVTRWLQVQRKYSVQFQTENMLHVHLLKLYVRLNNLIKKYEVLGVFLTSVMINRLHHWWSNWDRT